MDKINVWGNVNFHELALQKYHQTFANERLFSNGNIKSNIKVKLDKLNINVDFDKFRLDNENDGETQRSKFKRVVTNTLRYEFAKSARETFKNNYAIWQPSLSRRRRLKHINNYGKVFAVKVGINGDFPSLEYGCKCGLLILPVKTKDIEKVTYSVGSKNPSNLIKPSLSNIISQVSPPKLKSSFEYKDLFVGCVLGSYFVTKQNRVEDNKLTNKGLMDYININNKLIPIRIKKQNKKYYFVSVVYSLDKESDKNIYKCVVKIEKKYIIHNDDLYYIRYKDLNVVEELILDYDANIDCDIVLINVGGYNL